jgi:hypothetical protein
MPSRGTDEIAVARPPRPTRADAVCVSAVPGIKDIGRDYA